MAVSEPTKYMTKLQGARVLIIGGSSGIGYGVAEALLEHGASVILSSSSQERVNKAVRQLKTTYPSASSGDRVQGFTCDLSSADTVEAEVAGLFDAVKPGGKLDHVVYTAGDKLATGKLEDFTVHQVQQAGMVRFFAVFAVAKHLRAHLKPGPGASFVMTTGGGSDRPRPDWTVVITYLVALEGLCRCLARELAPLRVNIVGPGPIETELWDNLRAAGTYEGFKTAVTGTLATGVFGAVDDVVESYLCCMKDRNMTGSMIYSNAGALLM